jgi:hypothetical protein
MFGHQYYHSIIRKYVIAFGNLFNDIVVQRFDKSGDRIQSIAVPIAYGPKESFLVRLRQDPNLDSEVAITLPRMGFQIVGLNYSPNRKLSSTLRNNKAIAGQNRNNTQFVPVPYDFNFDLYVFVNNTSDGTQIIEQILPHFRPEFTTAINIIPEMDISVDTPVILESVDIEDLYEGDLITRQALIYNLSFKMTCYLFGPVLEKGTINQAMISIGNLAVNEELERVVVTESGTTINMDGFF